MELMIALIDTINKFENGEVNDDDEDDDEDNEDKDEDTEDEDNDIPFFYVVGSPPSTGKVLENNIRNKTNKRTLEYNNHENEDDIEVKVIKITTEKIIPTNITSIKKRKYNDKKKDGLNEIERILQHIFLHMK